VITGSLREGESRLGSGAARGYRQVGARAVPPALNTHGARMSVRLIEWVAFRGVAMACKHHDPLPVRDSRLGPPGAHAISRAGCGGVCWRIEPLSSHPALMFGLVIPFTGSKGAEPNQLVFGLTSAPLGRRWIADLPLSVRRMLRGHAWAVATRGHRRPDD